MNKEYGLVLAGGGSKGCYQLGAWKALKELDIKINAVVGSSIGSINAATIAQDAYEIAAEIWGNIGLERVIDIPAEFVVDGRIKINHKNIGSLNKMVEAYFAHNGFDTAPLRKLLSEHIDEDKIRNSDIDFGLTTINLTKAKSQELFIDDIPKGQIVDYILASAAFPAFKSTKINGNTFLDGGMSDNIPFDMLKNKGYKNIIVIDISGVGMNKRPNIIGTNTIYLRNSIDFGSIADFKGVLNFNKNFIDQFTLLGYLDTMKVFEKNFGKHYFITKDDKYSEINDIIKKPENLARYKKTVSKKYSCHLEPAMMLLDLACLYYKIERIKEYTFTELLDEFVAIREKEDSKLIKKIAYKKYKICADLLSELIKQ